MKNVAWLKWGGTGFVLSGILLTNLNLYPLNIMVHGTGSLGWMLASIQPSEPVPCTIILSG